ncbi:hypothetical protein KC19_4G099200 [Ceratodon purpureus]|uniref:Uncharacterized protein n=1 Tax=Ceratodon purpureus TaxID=3225 RepID=A0A8T0I8Y1_CERPU|nr:hypothetical protein KC19_4G099200 [Ceratodon purpureus]
MSLSTVHNTTPLNVYHFLLFRSIYTLPNCLNENESTIKVFVITARPDDVTGIFLCIPDTKVSRFWYRRGSSISGIRQKICTGLVWPITAPAARACSGVDSTHPSCAVKVERNPHTNAWLWKF